MRRRIIGGDLRSGLVTQEPETEENPMSGAYPASTPFRCTTLTHMRSRYAKPHCGTR